MRGHSIRCGKPDGTGRRSPIASEFLGISIAVALKLSGLPAHCKISEAPHPCPQGRRRQADLPTNASEEALPSRPQSMRKGETQSAIKAGAVILIRLCLQG